MKNPAAQQSISISLSNASRRGFAAFWVAALLLSPEAAQAADAHSGWSFSFTPVLIPPKGEHPLGGGADPEVKYTLDQGGARLSAGLRIGGYYAQSAFGVTAMPTLRITVPIGPVEPYAAFGMGYGWIPEEEGEGVATMSRLGIVFRLSDSLAIGVEGTLQQIEGTNFSFPSIGSMVSFDL